jgi:hypothetical protein
LALSTKPELGVSSQSGADKSGEKFKINSPFDSTKSFTEIEKRISQLSLNTFNFGETDDNLDPFSLIMNKYQT